MKILRETEVSPTLVVTFIVLAGIVLLMQGGKLGAYAKEVERLELRNAHITLAHEWTKRELRKKVPVEIREIIKRVPVEVEPEVVIEWRTREVPVEVERIRDVVRWMGVECESVDWTVAEEPPVSMSGKVATFRTEHGNTIAAGVASVEVAGVSLAEGVEFDFDATEAFALARSADRKWRRYVGVQYGVLIDSTDLYSQSFEPERLRVYGGFERRFKRFTLALGAHYQSSSAGTDSRVEW